MLFNSLQFALFFVVVFLLYLLLNHKWQNRALVVASCIFYAAWDWRFLSLIFISITTDYFCSISIGRSDNEKVKKQFLIFSIVVNLFILGFFKYFNFFSANLTRLINLFGFSIHPHTIDIILPLGISFYTFRTMSYTIDVYTGKIKPTRDYIDYALFVIFFPLLLAGPIMRAGDLLPQISSLRKPTLKKIYEGCYFIFWGLFQKVFIADNLAYIADTMFNPPPPYNGIKILLGLYAFAFQIYCDFAGYSNMAMGIGRCMGFDILLNFNLPYFAKNPQDFWQRWHISLSTWLRDYIYFPIAIIKRTWGSWGFVFATMVTFILCGFWHGAAWTFIIWGAYWGVLLVGYNFLKPTLKKIQNPKNVILERIWFWIKIILFFHLTCLGWLIFKSSSMTQAYRGLHDLLFNFSWVKQIGLKTNLYRIIFYSIILIIVEVFQFKKNDLLIIFKWPSLIRTIFYLICFYAIVIFGVNNAQMFLYFQF